MPAQRPTHLRLALDVAETPHALARIVAACAARPLEVEALSFRRRRVELLLRGEAHQLSLTAARLGQLVDVSEVQELNGAPPAPVRR